MSWSFAGIAFERVLTGDSDPRWFAQDIAVTVDVVAGDVSAVPRQYVDIGARQYEPLELDAAVASPAVRAALIAAVGQQGTLVRPGGQSGTALLVRADPLARQGGTYYRLRLAFRFVS